MNKTIKHTTLLFSIAFISLSFNSNELPLVNQKVVEYCLKHLNKKVDRGECWDLAKYALDYADADWKTPFDFGTKYNYKTTPILPGDIIQFEKVTIADNTMSMSLPHHTAVVTEVKNGLNIVIAHQNFAGKKKVTLTDVNFANVKKGKVQFYRPVAK